MGAIRSNLNYVHRASCGFYRLPLASQVFGRRITIGSTSIMTNRFSSGGCCRTLREFEMLSSKCELCKHVGAGYWGQGTIRDTLAISRRFWAVKCTLLLPVLLACADTLPNARIPSDYPVVVRKPPLSVYPLRYLPTSAFLTSLQLRSNYCCVWSRRERF